MKELKRYDYKKLSNIYNKDFKKHIEPILLKDKCEICGSGGKLDLVYDKPFFNMIFEAYEMIGIYDLWATLDENQTKLVRDILLGMQISRKNYTFCRDCWYLFLKYGYKKTKDTRLNINIIK